MPRVALPLPVPLTAAARRFADWRLTRTTRRLPAGLWSEAVGLGIRYGVSRTARALRVPYYDLKRRMDAGVGQATARPAFVEIVPVSPGATAEWRIEFESTSGAKMRIHTSARGAPDVAALARIFLAEGR